MWGIDISLKLWWLHVWQRYALLHQPGRHYKCMAAAQSPCFAMTSLLSSQRGVPVLLGIAPGASMLMMLDMCHSSVMAQTHQGCCSRLEVLLLSCVLIEDPCEVVGLSSVAISVPLRVFWRCNGDCRARHSMDAVLLAPARHAVLQGGPDTHNNLHIIRKFLCSMG